SLRILSCITVSQTGHCLAGTLHYAGDQILGARLWIPKRCERCPVTHNPSEKAVVADAQRPQYSQQRKSRRAKIAKPVRVRPSDPLEEHFEDLPISLNASKEGIYFVSRHKGYYKGMRVFVTFPYSSPHDPMNCEYVAEV